eukprot:6450111-Amphidinium_carterae.1
MAKQMLQPKVSGVIFWTKYFEWMFDTMRTVPSSSDYHRRPSSHFDFFSKVVLLQGLELRACIRIPTSYLSRTRKLTNM